MAQAVSLQTSGGQNVNCQQKDGYTEVKFNHNTFNGKWNGYYGSDWVTSYTSGTKHRFIFTFKSGVPSGLDLHFVVTTVEDWNNDPQKKLVDVAIEDGVTSFQYDIEQEYGHIQITNTGENNLILEVVSITREIISASSVNAPMITPASGTTYDGDLSVTITKGEGNEKVVYSVSGATTGNETDEFTGESKTLTLTGTGAITVTATGYVGSDASEATTNTYTYSIPDGHLTADITYYDIVPLTMSDGTTPAYYDFEDGTTFITQTSNIDAGKLSIVDCDADHTTSTGSTKCMKVDLSDKSASSNFYDVQLQLVFNSALTQNHTYRVHFWTKAETETSNETRVRFQENGNDWTEYNRRDVTYGTSWTEYSYEISANGSDCTMMVFDLGKVASNTIYLDDVAVFDVTNGNTAVEFDSQKATAVIANTVFADYAAGDYVLLNVTGDPSVVSYKPYAVGDEYAISNAPSYTDLTQTNDAWLIPVTADMISNGLSIKGYDMTLTSAEIYKNVTVSETVDNDITKYDHVVLNLNRTFAKETWNTICLPFKPTADQATEMFGEGYKIAEFTSVSGETMQFTKLSSIDAFVAGTPYLVWVTQNERSSFTFFDVDITARVPQSVEQRGGNYQFVGLFAKKSFEESEWPTTRFVAAGNKLKTPNSTGALKALRAYFVVPAGSASAPALSIDGEGEATSIEDLENSRTEELNIYYDLSGRRVVKPTKGVYIMNGKKVILK